MVTQHGKPWQELGQLWISDGKRDGRGRIELRVWLDDDQPLEARFAHHDTASKNATVPDQWLHPSPREEPHDE